jgi:hypothetical protein
MKLLISANGRDDCSVSCDDAGLDSIEDDCGDADKDICEGSIEASCKVTSEDIPEPDGYNKNHIKNGADSVSNVRQKTDKFLRKLWQWRGIASFFADRRAGLAAYE